jgi:hypothetical protein
MSAPTLDAGGAQPGFFNKLFTALNKPEAQAFLLNMGSTLLRPPQFGQTTAQQIGQGLISGYGGLSNLNAQRMAQAEMQRKAGLEQRKVAADEQATQNQGERWRGQTTGEAQGRTNAVAKAQEESVNEQAKLAETRRLNTGNLEDKAAGQGLEQQRITVLERQAVVAEKQAETARRNGVATATIGRMNAAANQARAQAETLKAYVTIDKAEKEGKITDKDRLNASRSSVAQAITSIIMNFDPKTDDPKVRDEQLAQLQKFTADQFKVLQKEAISTPTGADPTMDFWKRHNLTPPKK